MKGIFEATIHIRSNGPSTITKTDLDGVSQSHPISLSDLTNTFKSHSHNPMAFLHPQLIATDYQEKVVFWRPPQLQELIFRVSGSGSKKEFQHVTVPLPGLVAIFAPKDNDMNLVATKEKGRPTLDTKLYKAPLPNITSDRGGVCMGTTLMSQTGVAVDIDPDLMWTEFFLSAFTSHSANNRVKNHPDDVCPFILDLDDQKVFPKKELLSIDSTLYDWIQRYG